MTDGKVETFLGIPVDQDDYDNGYGDRVEQWDQEELAAFVEPLLAGGVSLTWAQYTPYFQDGDPCIFSLYDLYVKVDGIPEDAEFAYQTEGFVSPSSVYIQGGDEVRFQRLPADHPDYRVGQEFRNYGYVSTGRSFDRHPLAAEMEELASKFQHFEELLLKTFGDHVEVIVTPERILANHYDHD